jgi:uncharacterized protein DUF2786
MNAQDKIADRIRKLLALAGNNSSEAEAAAAMDRAMALMTEYNLSMAEVEANGDAKQNERIEAVFNGTSARQTWARSIWYAVSEVNFCKYFFTSSERRGSAQKTDRHYVLGTRGNVETARLMAEYLVLTVDRLAKAEPTLHGANDFHAFKVGASRRLATRLREQRDARLATERVAQAAASKHPAYAGTTLPAIANLYKAHQLANDSLFSSLHTFKLGKAKSPTTSRAGAYARGQAAANGVGLDRQVSRSGSQVRLTAR